MQHPRRLPGVSQKLWVVPEFLRLDLSRRELVQPASKLIPGVAGHGQGHEIVIAFCDQFGAGGQSRHLAITDVEQARTPQQDADTTGHG
jgi:hypothetical protein